MERRSCFLNTPFTPHLDGDQHQNSNVEFSCSNQQVKQEKKYNDFHQSQLSSSTLESDFHICSESLSLMLSSSQKPHSCCSSRSPAWSRCYFDLKNMLPTSCFPHFAEPYSCGTERRSFSLSCVIDRDPWSWEECWRHNHRASTQLCSTTWEMMAPCSGDKEPQLLEWGGNSVTGKAEGVAAAPRKILLILSSSLLSVDQELLL